MRPLLVVLTFLFVSASFAQEEDSSVKQTINQLFEGMRRSDTAMIRSAFSSNPLLQTVSKNKAGEVVVRTEPLDSFIAFIGKPHTDIYDERITFDLIRVDGELAVAWAPYQFFVNNTFSQCGVDSFQLIKRNGKWKIHYLIDTRRRTKCEGLSAP